MPFHHLPVMVDDVVALTRDLPAGTFLDATLGAAGHAGAVLEANPGLNLVGIDQDPSALEAAARRLEPMADRVRLVRSRFDRLADALTQPPGLADAGSVPDDVDRGTLSGFLFDLGVSSPQLDRSERGFSFRHDGPLDMRMDPDAALSAAQVVNDYDVDQLASIIHRYGDERFAKRIAASIARRRPLSGTEALAQAVVEAIPAPARRTGGHPAKRTFQAIRIEVNSELNVLRPALEAALDALMIGGRGLVLTYHSGEDRIVKDVFRDRTTVDTPARLPVAGPDAPYRIVRPAARKAGEAEAEANPRSTSARLRAIERVAA